MTNGDSVVEPLRRVTGEEVLPWRDVLHEGPLEDVAPEELRELRAAFLADHGWSDEDAIRAELAARDEHVSRARHVVLWFEHDLYDQLQLLQVLTLVRDDAVVELVQSDDYLGALEDHALAELWFARRAVDAETIALARDAWRAVCTGDVTRVLARDTSALPYLAPALRRLLEEREPLPRTKRQLLRSLADGAKTPIELFAASQAQEEAVFLGDTWCFQYLYELAQDGLVTPLPPPPPRGDEAAFTSTRIELTPAGRELV